MKKIWVVSWARALGGNETPVDAYAGTEGAYTSFGDALKAMTHCKDEFLKEIIAAVEDSRDREVLEAGLRVYGSEREEYYEIDYTNPNNLPIEIYISVRETNLYD